VREKVIKKPNKDIVSYYRCDIHYKVNHLYLYLW